MHRAESRPPSRYRYLPLMLLALASLFASSYLFFTLRSLERKELEVQFQHAAANRIALLHRDHLRHLENLRALAGLYGASEHVSRQEFKIFIDNFSPGDTDLQALEWVPRVLHRDRGRYEEAARREGFPGFRISENDPDGERVPAALRKEYFPVYYVEPYSGNEAALGFDLASEPTRRQALNKARDSGEMTISSIVDLLQRKGEGGHLAFLPLYKKGEPGATVEERRRSLEGFLVGVFRYGDIAREALAFSDPVGIDLHFYDPTAPKGERLRLFFPSRTWASPPPPSEDGEVLRAGLHHEEGFRMADQKILVLATPAPAFYEGRQKWRSWAVLAGGLLFSGLVLGYIFLQVKRVALAKLFAAEQARAKERLELEVEERRRAEEGLKVANRELEAFVYTVSHDLRTPLTPIIGFAEFLQENYREALDEAALDCLAEIEKQGGRMLSLMEDLLTLARVGQLERPEAPVEVKEVIDKVLEDRREEIASAGGRVEVGRLPSLLVPESMLTQIFDNLIGNALRYGGGTIEVGCARQGEKVRFYVRDHGPGIPEGERERIFEVFFRGATGKSKKGTGVGLATVQKIARLYGGRAWVEETPGGGSTFWVEMVDEEVPEGTG